MAIWANQKGEPLTEDGEFALRSELGELMRIAPIAMPGSLYGASVSARTFEDVYRAIGNPIDFEEAISAGNTDGKGHRMFGRIPGFAEFLASHAKDPNKVNLIKKWKERQFGDSFQSARSTLFGKQLEN